MSFSVSLSAMVKIVRRLRHFNTRIASTYDFVIEDVDENVQDYLDNDFIAIEAVGEASKRAEVACSKYVN